MTTDTAIKTVEDSYLYSLDQYINDYTEGYEEENFLWNPIVPYEQENDFRVDKKDDTWIIGMRSPTFYPDCDIIEYLTHELFYTCIIDDEYNLIVKSHSSDNPYVDADLVSRDFDKAIEWRERNKVVDAAYFKMIEAQENFRILERKLYA